MPDTLCPFKVDGNLMGDEAGGKTMNDITGFTLKSLETMTDLERGFSRLNGCPVAGIEKLLKKKEYSCLTAQSLKM